MKKNLAKVLIMCLLFSTMIVHIQQIVSAAVQTYYVSPEGNDNNPGTQSQPFLTIGKAKAIVRTINSNMTDDIIVYLRGGTYNLSRK